MLKDLCGIWQHSYREETIRNNCEKFIDHVADLYSDIIEEAESVKDVYIQELESMYILYLTFFWLFSTFHVGT